MRRVLGVLVLFAVAVDADAAARIARVGPPAAAISGVVGVPGTSTYFASANGGGVFRSTDGGNNWEPVNTGLADLHIRGLGLGSSTPATLWATGTYALNRSVNGGESWSAVDWCGTGTCGGVFSLAVSPDGSRTYLGTWDGEVWVSGNGGASFSEASLPPSTWNPSGGISSAVLVRLAEDGSAVFAAGGYGSPSILYKSADGGVTWAGMQAPSTACISAMAADGPQLYVGSSCGGENQPTVFRTEDDGATWEPPYFVVGETESGPGGVVYFDRRIAGLAIDPEAIGDARLLAGTEQDGIYRPYAFTSLAGFPHEASVDFVYVDAMLVSGGHLSYGGRKWENAEGRGALFRVTLNDNTHTVINSGLHASTVNVIALDPTNHERVWVGGGSTMHTEGGVWISSDGGQHWSEKIDGLVLTGTTRVPSVYDLSVGQSNPNFAVAVASNGGVYRTSSGGGTWTRATTPPGSSAEMEVLVDPDEASRILLGSSPLQRSLDSGGNWTAAGAYGEVTVLEQFGSEILMAAGAAGDWHLYASIDFGGSWTPLGALPFKAGSLARSGTTLYAAAVAGLGGTGPKLVRSADGGTTWPDATGNLPLPPGGEVTFVAADPSVEGTIYAILPGAWFASSLEMSSDGGATWTTVAEFQSKASTLVVRPTLPRRVLVATDGEGTIEVTIPAASTTVMTSSLNPATPTERVTLRAGVTSPTAGTPAGSVTFRSGTTELSTVTLTGGEASFSTTALAEGSHSLTASYSGDEHYDASTSDSLAQVVSPATLTAPAALSAAATSTSSVLTSWSSVEGATSYEVYLRLPSDSVVKIATTAATSYLHSSLDPETTYVYRVRANRHSMTAERDPLGYGNKHFVR